MVKDVLKRLNSAKLDPIYPPGPSAAWAATVYADGRRLATAAATLHVQHVASPILGALSYTEAR
jgi:hypothetical protein